MREIKFRAWNKVEKRMEIVNGLNFWWGDIDTKVTELELAGTPKLMKDYELMQYTGLKDKNGTEIYERDIVKASDELSEYAYPFEVKWYEDGWHLHWPNLEEIPERSILEPPMLEVIGNIYENPDLAQPEQGEDK